MEVYIAPTQTGRNNKRYHTRRCYRVTDEHIERDTRQLIGYPENWQECATCAGTEMVDGGGKKLANALLGLHDD